MNGIRRALNSSDYSYVKGRPTEMLVRQLQANRTAARYRNPETGRRHFAHVLPFRPHFIGEMLAMHAELKRRKSQ